MADRAFAWPKEKRGAVSLSFDDGRASQIEQGIPLLDRFDIRATFYLNPPKLVAGQLTHWKDALKRGHEMGNHTCSHPCSGNFEWSRHNAIEDYSLERMEKEISDCSDQIKELLGTSPQTFAYPCGQTYVGRGEGLQSVVPMVARQFKAGRAYLTEHANDPLYADLSLLGAMGSDDISFEIMRKAVDQAMQAGSWLIFAGHDMAESGAHQVTRLAELEKLLRYLKAPEQNTWVSTVEEVAQWIKSGRDNF